MSDPKNKKSDPAPKQDDTAKGPVITVTASSNRRREGRRFPKGQPVEIHASELSEDQWRAIMADPVLQVSPPID